MNGYLLLVYVYCSYSDIHVVVTVVEEIAKYISWYLYSSVVDCYTGIVDGYIIMHGFALLSMVPVIQGYRWLYTGLYR